jgi:hypothetical protein
VASGQHPSPHDDEDEQDWGVETTATTGLTSYFRERHIFTCKVMVLGVVRKRALANSSNEAGKAKSRPMITPDRQSGRVTSQKLRRGEAPMSRAAREGPRGSGRR